MVPAPAHFPLSALYLPSSTPSHPTPLLTPPATHQTNKCDGACPWADADCLEIGNNLTSIDLTQSASYFSWYAIANAPLIMSTPVDTMEPAVLNILQSPEVIAVNQDYAGKKGQPVSSPLSRRCTGHCGHCGRHTAHAIRHTPCTMHHTPCTMHHAPCTMHHTPCTIHHAPFTIRHAPYTIHHTPCTIHHTTYTIHHTPYTIRHAPCTIHHIHTPYTIRHAPYTISIHHTPYAIHHTPFTIHHSPFTMHHTPCTIHHTPYTIHHTPCTIRHAPYPFTIHHTLSSPPAVALCGRSLSPPRTDPLHSF
jgi:hypothetical protein